MVSICDTDPMMVGHWRYFVDDFVQRFAESNSDLRPELRLAHEVG